MSCRLGTPRDDCESLFPRKKSDSSLSGGAGEAVDDEDLESSWSSDAEGVDAAADPTTGANTGAGGGVGTGSMSLSLTAAAGLVTTEGCISR
jgi:hypothetical protein